jgi:uncharacterized protein YfaS (alpha-2-macroglobulin family)
VWTAVQEGQAIPQSRRAAGNDDKPQTRASIVQVTNLGITVKDSPQNTIVFVTRLDNGSPVEGANVSIIGLDNKVLERTDRERRHRECLGDAAPRSQRLVEVCLHRHRREGR